MIRRLWILSVVTLIASVFGGKPALAQVGLESPDGNPAQVGSSAVNWAGPGRETVPDWAQPGRIRFSRWDGGRIETAKAILSGWTGFNPPDPDLLETMTNWYELETVSLLKQADINLVWVTLSVGFSNETERRHQQQVRDYIAECHRQGIHVMAYESVANMFWEDMYRAEPESKEWTSLDKNGKPIPYGGAAYGKMRHVTRYMANLEHPGWRAYLRKRIDLAIDAGADGIMYDNNFGNRLPELYAEIQQYATSRKTDFLVMANFHGDGYHINRLINCMTTEDGREPGIYKKAGTPPEDTKNPEYVKANWVNNIGLFRIHEALSDGWKPVMIENGRQEAVDRLVGLPSPERCQLSLAESMMFGVAHEMFVEGGTAHRLRINDPATMKTWSSIGDYNRFFAEHEGLYVGARSQADILVILEDGSSQVPLLNSLAAEKLLFDAQYAWGVNPEQLWRYQAVVVLATKVQASLLATLDRYAKQGGNVVAIESAVRQDESGKSITPTAFIKKVPYRGPKDISTLAAAISAATPKRGATLDAPVGVLFNVTMQSQPPRTLVHLLNYTLDSTGPVKLSLPGGFNGPHWLLRTSGRCLTGSSPPLKTELRSRSPTCTFIPS